MYEIYQKLLEPIHDDIPVKDFFCGSGRTYTETENAIGYTTTWSEWRLPMQTKVSKTYRLAQLAKLIYSWNMTEASLGLSAINCYYESDEYPFMNTGEVLDELCDKLSGKCCLFLGHIPILEKKLQSYATILHIAKYVQMDDDYPMSAFYYMLENVDCIICSELSLIDKSFQQVIQYANEKLVIVCGPGVPLASILLEHGVDLIISLESNENEKSCIKLGISSLPQLSFQKTIHTAEYQSGHDSFQTCKVIGNYCSHAGLELRKEATDI